MHVCLQGMILRNWQEENLIGSVKKRKKEKKIHSHQTYSMLRPEGKLAKAYERQLVMGAFCHLTDTLSMKLISQQKWGATRCFLAHVLILFLICPSTSKFELLSPNTNMFLEILLVLLIQVANSDKHVLSPSLVWTSLDNPSPPPHSVFTFKKNTTHTPTTTTKQSRVKD